MTATMRPAATAAPAVPEVLGRTRDAVQPALRAAVDRLDETSRAISAYHLGWTDADGTPVSGSNGGKAVRSALAVLSALAAGAPQQTGVPGAVAVELVHNFSLVHDDLMDGDTERRHRPTVWALWGAPSAILTGDAMLALAQEVVLDSGSPHAIAAGRLVSETTRRLIHGQVLDVQFEQRDDVTLPECVTMAAGKTGALLSASCAIGAVLAGAPAEVVGALAVFGEEIGLAFQLVDDVLGIWGDPAVTGKPVYSDLRARKKSLPVTYATTHGGAAGDELAKWLAGGETGDEAELARVAALVESAGGREWATAEAARRVETAERAVAAIPAGPREELIGIARFIVHREA
ncbi:polyprenyl synthetase family protein [Amycolatopsis sp. FDAARGOS 1241]|uniref:polyprenyl synthetase family protein n=1 Tax=Amycolatopsis sp. FDAARGOS 1241 TaxID=2778070 RepID=UPI00194F7E56|nr:polyprenyl synthetase family protein [Amycolatopsis sp. FDAARGOS 1241]QRP43398.1 polyprenyl synthetase family protein [Amycolatopsis sp. FDAARGOS 1241]